MTIKNKSFKLVCSSKEDNFRAASLLLSLGFRYWDGKTDAQSISNHTWNEGYYHLRVRDDGEFVGNNEASVTHSSPVFLFPSELPALMECLFPDKIQEVVVNGVGQYNATITKKGVQVGCQTISFDKVREIMKGIETIEKEG